MPEPTYVSEKVPRDVCDERSKRIEEGINALQKGQEEVKKSVDNIVGAHDNRITQNDKRITQNELIIVELKQRERNGDRVHKETTSRVTMWITVGMFLATVVVVFIPKIVSLFVK